MTTSLSHHIRRWLPKALLVLLWGAACYWFFDSRLRYHFFYQEQNMLFLNDTEYLASYFRRPAWLACLVGDFLTQFYYYLFAGPALLTVTLLTLGDLSRRLIERSLGATLSAQGSRIMAWAATIASLVFITYVARLCLDETFTLASPIAMCGGMALWLAHDMAHSRLQRWWLRALTFAAALALAYWSFGFGAYTMLLPEVVKAATLTVRRRGRLWTVVPTLAIAATPFCIMPAVADHYHISTQRALHYPGTGSWVDWDYVKTYENTLALDNEYYFGHYNKVVGMYKTIKGEKNDQMAFFNCLALAQMGLLPEMLPEIDNPFLGTFLTIGEDTPMYSIMMINELYYLIGDMTYAERAALLANTFSPTTRNVRMVKRLAEANLVKGDEAAAMKYLRLLHKTTVYRQWAIDHTPGTMSEEVKAEIARKREFVNTNDDIRLGDNCYTILTQLLDSNPKNSMALQFLLCSDMLSGQRDTFVSDYERYGNGGKPLFDKIYRQTKASMTQAQTSGQQ